MRGREQRLGVVEAGGGGGGGMSCWLYVESWRCLWLAMGEASRAHRRRHRHLLTKECVLYRRGGEVVRARGLEQRADAGEAVSEDGGGVTGEEGEESKDRVGGGEGVGLE